MQTNIDEKDNCSIKCDKTFPKGSHLKSYRQTNYQYYCNQCDKMYINSYSLTEHMRIHTGERPYQCSYCDEAFSLKGSLVGHIKKHISKGQYQCSHCDKTYKRKYLVTDHMRRHTGERPYQCSHCDKNFYQKIQLTQHLRLHSGETPSPHPPYPAMIASAIKALHERGGSSRQAILKYILANYKFNDAAKVQLSVKLAIRKMLAGKKIILVKGSFKLAKDENYSEYKKAAKKAYQCSQCDKGFSRNSDLTIHMRFHTGETPYQCNQCNVAFSRNCDLTRHMRIHTVERSYQCSTSGTVHTPSKYLKSDKSISQNLKKQALENTLVYVSDMCVETYLFENYLKPSKKSDTNNLSKIKVEVKEEQMNSENSDIGNLSELKVEVNEEQFDSENNDISNFSELKVEVKEEQINS